MVRDDGRVKLIDLGFGKQVGTSADFDKSISLNWWCELPQEFQRKEYDFKTEVYFVGKLFEKMIHDLNLVDFAFKALLLRMCRHDPDERPDGFQIIEQEIRSKCFDEVKFTENELSAYRDFANALYGMLNKIEYGCKYVNDVEQVRARLTELFGRVMLEDNVPEPAEVGRCVLDGNWYFNKNFYFSTDILRRFLDLLRGLSKAKCNIVLANLHARLKTIPRYSPPNPTLEEDIPF